ncbi:MAG TPA: glutamine amidotransferase, partial [Phycisphaerae bacterium]|nr:glutamine amidotransferase [Phycisphaerae bacterium]
MLLERFDRPWCLWLLLIVVLLWWSSRRSLSGLGPIRGWLALLARVVVCVMLIFVMAGMHKIQKNDDLNVLFVLDQSRSIPAAARNDAQEFIKNSTKFMRPNDRAAVLTFDGQTNIEQLPSRPGPDGGIHVATPWPDGLKPDRTNIAQALRVASACALDSTNNRIVLLSDGNQNVGDAAEEVRSARANRMTLDVVPLAQQEGSDVVFEALRAPSYAHLHERIQLRLTLTTQVETSGRIVLYQRVGQEEKQIDLDAAAKGQGMRKTLHPGRNSFVVRLPIEDERAHEFRAEFVPDDPAADVIKQNNVARAFTNVEGTQLVLLLGTERDQPENQLLADALQQEKISVQMENAAAVSLETSLLQDYAAIILANVPAELFNQTQQQSLAAYVRDLGGGLIMIGGDDSFAAGGWQGSPVEDVMPVKFDVDAVKQIPRGALAIVMHSCEMPQGNKWGIETAVAALKALSSLDYFGVVSLGMGGYGWDIDLTPATNKDAIAARLRKMQNSDMPDFDTPMRMAYQGLMSKKDAGVRHMIVISDGDPAAPASGLLNQMVGSKVTCSTVSIFPHGGREISTLKEIARVCKGNYYPLMNPGDENKLPKIFIKEAKTVRRPLVRDEVFKPVVKPSVSDVMQGISGPIPQLGGYVVTTPRRVPDVEMPMVTSRGDPLLAHWFCGWGRSIAFTSGRWKHWGADWAAWPSFSKLWAQAIRWCMQQGTAANYDVQNVIEGDEGHIIIESADDKGFSDFRQFSGRVLTPAGTSAPVTITQTGPGRYEGRYPVGPQGTYLMQVVAPGSKDSKPAVIRTGVTQAYSPEFKDHGTNESLLSELKDLGGGRALALSGDPKTIFEHNLPPAIARSPIWDKLLKLAVFLFLLDVAIRRVALDPVKLVVMTRDYIGSLAGRFRAGERAQVVLTDLKTTREQ